MTTINKNGTFKIQLKEGGTITKYCDSKIHNLWKGRDADHKIVGEKTSDIKNENAFTWTVNIIEQQVGYWDVYLYFRTRDENHYFGVKESDLLSIEKI